MKKNIIYEVKQDITVNFKYSVLFTSSTFSSSNTTLADVLFSHRPKLSKITHQDNNIPSSIREIQPKVLAVIDDSVIQESANLIDELKSYAMVYQFELVRSPLIVPGGEQIKKNMDYLESIYQLVAEEQIDRHSYILVIGGGAVLDAVGFAAATAHRGVRLIRMPTTVLAQNDAGVGVKTGINYLGRKNYLGAFAPPYAVINDFDLLSTLKNRDKLAGMAEAVKVALIKDRQFFNELYDQRHALACFETSAMQRMIIRCAELHLNHIQNSGDAFEMGSARPLDFGHWSAHKLEALSNYTLKHGEAVAIGIALDTLYSYTQQMITKSICDQVLMLLIDLGFDLSCPVLMQLDVPTALAEFREHLGGVLCITLLTGLGEAMEVNHIHEETMQHCVVQLQDFHGDYKPVQSNGR